MEGYRSVSLKGEVVEKLQKRAKKEDKKLSNLLDEFLEGKEGEGITKNDLEKLKKEISEEIRQIIREEVTAILEEAKRW